MNSIASVSKKLTDKATKQTGEFYMRLLRISVGSKKWLFVVTRVSSSIK